PNVVYDLYYASEILKLINANASNFIQINELLQKFILKDGSFVSSYEELKQNIANEDKIRTTVMAISILNKSNQKIPQNTVKWIRESWGKTQKNDANITKLIQLILALEIINKNENTDINSEIYPEKELFQTYYNRVMGGIGSDETLLYDLQNCANLKKFFKFDSKLSMLLIQRLYDNQNRDGGWNIFLDNMSDEQGTEIALSIL
ncbi:hypothetical protein, partial [Cytobacillus praedii]|uniref:hypothetical protein n=1 Tax=Cytobacillus praedii TaxID=1742358 RepID=UPI0013F46B5F